MNLFGFDILNLFNDSAKKAMGLNDTVFNCFPTHKVYKYKKYIILMHLEKVEKDLTSAIKTTVCSSCLNYKTYLLVAKEYCRCLKEKIEFITTSTM